MKYLLSLLLAVCLFAQTPTPGTVSQTTTSTVTAVASSVSCSFTHATPDPKPVTFHISCQSAAGSTMTQDIVGMVSASASFTNGVDRITWSINLDAAGMLAWEIMANNVTKTGTF